MSLQKITINVVDVETTGFSGPPKGDFLEIANTPITVLFEDGELYNLQVGNTYAVLANPGCDCHIEALATHHIVPELYRNAKPSRVVHDEFMSQECNFWAAHNASFEQKFLSTDVPWICTMKVAQVIYPDAPSYKNQVLRYHLGLDKHMEHSRTLPAHRAGPDTYVTAFLLAKMIASKKMTLDEMASLTSSRILQGKIPFGKHRGTPWSNLPLSYLQWLAKNSEDAQVVETARYHLRR